MQASRVNSSFVLTLFAWLLGITIASPLNGALGERRQACNVDDLLQALQAPSQASEATPFCSSYLCAQATFTSGPQSTVTTAAHPMSLYKLQPYAYDEVPLTYSSPPAASTVPGNPGCYEYADGDDCPLSQKRAAAVETAPAMLQNRQGCSAPPLPSFIASTYAEASISSACSCLLSSATPTATAAQASSMCTSITGSYPSTTVPAFCNPSLHVNAPSLDSTRSLPLATATISMVSNKINCCSECAGIFNCVAWQFLPVASDSPSARQPGGFEPWGRGDCEVIYHTGFPDDNLGVSTEGASAVCPNGKVGDILSGSNNNPGGNNETWSNLYYNGWNQGSCGAPLNDRESGSDPGAGDALCSEA